MPKYNNSPIEEAMCELTFAPLGPAGQWDATLPGRMIVDDRLKHIYNGTPRPQTMQEVTAASAQGIGQASVSTSTVLLRVLLPTADNKAVLGIGPNTLSVSSLKPYEGWNERFRNRIKEAVEVYYDVAQRSPVVRVVVKYINRLVTPVPFTGQVSRFLADIKPDITGTTDASEVITANINSFHLRKEYTTLDGVRIFVTQATIQPEEPLKSSEYLLDIEAVWDREHLTTIPDMMQKIERLHDIEGAVFEALIEPRARELFDAKA